MPSPRTMLLVAAVLAGAGGAAACTSLRVPPRAPSFPGSELLRTSSAGIELAARPVDGLELNWELFDDDLPEAGLAAVWVTLENRAAEPLDLGRLRWSLDLRGRRLPGLDVDGILKRFYKARKIRMYTVQTDSSVRAELGRALLAPGTVAPGASASGFVVLKIDPADAVAWTRGVLRARGLRVGDRELDLALPLVHAKP